MAEYAPHPKVRFSDKNSIIAVLCKQGAKKHSALPHTLGSGQGSEHLAKCFATQLQFRAN